MKKFTPEQLIKIQARDCIEHEKKGSYLIRGVLHVRNNKKDGSSLCTYISQMLKYAGLPKAEIDVFKENLIKNYKISDEIVKEWWVS